MGMEIIVPALCWPELGPKNGVVHWGLNTAKEFKNFDLVLLCCSYVSIRGTEYEEADKPAQRCDNQ